MARDLESLAQTCEKTVFDKFGRELTRTLGKQGTRARLLNKN
jgi:hypothetical protein